ncbi:MAG TPA: hypothetical protein LFW14_03940 [Rickettsia endosymbiont of Degeeriella rufa]|nr:hypothetical protein [Rickettsia endosymbiont of Columbicola hoogstraali]HJD62703.1 hypothetical protein [Rickettsia endosymbiont of Degeeriella rufa]
MTKNSRDKLKYSEKLILDKVLNLAIKNEEYVILNEMIKRVPVLKNICMKKGLCMIIIIMSCLWERIADMLKFG